MYGKRWPPVPRIGEPLRASFSAKGFDLTYVSKPRGQKADCQTLSVAAALAKVRSASH
jgi:hypothetical protein